MSQQQDFNISDAPAQRAIEDVMAKLSSLTDLDGKAIFGEHVYPTTTFSFAEGIESNLPAALVYFDGDLEGYNTSNQFDELFFYPILEILFILYIPNNSDGSYPDVQRHQLAIHNLAIQNLRVPTDDLATGIPYQKNATTGKELWEFRKPEDNSMNHVTTHKFDVRNKYVEQGHKIAEWFYMSSVRIQVQINNYNADT